MRMLLMDMTSSRGRTILNLDLRSRHRDLRRSVLDSAAPLTRSSTPHIFTKFVNVLASRTEITVIFDDRVSD